MAFLKFIVKNKSNIAAAAGTTVSVAGITMGGYRHYITPSGSDIIERLENINGLGKSTVSKYNAHAGWISYSCTENPIYVPSIIWRGVGCPPIYNIKYGQYLFRAHDSPTNVKVDDNIVQVVKTYGLSEEEYAGRVSTYTINSKEDIDTLISCVKRFAVAGCIMREK